MPLRDRDVWTTVEFAKRCQLPVRTVQYRAAHGLIPAIRIGRDWLITELPTPEEVEHAAR